MLDLTFTAVYYAHLLQPAICSLDTAVASIYSCKLTKSISFQVMSEKRLSLGSPSFCVYTMNLRRPGLDIQKVKGQGHTAIEISECMSMPIPSSQFTDIH